MPPVTPRSNSLRRLLFLGGALAFSVLSCGREPTGPDSGGVRYSHGIAFQTEFPSAYTQYRQALQLANQTAGDVAEFSRVRILLRFPDGSIAKDTIIDFPVGALEVAVPLNIVLPASVPAAGVTMSGSLSYINSAGTVVWAKENQSVPVVPAVPGTPPPPPVVVVPTYVGPGATATAVRITPKTLTVNTGGSFSFSAVAVDAGGTVLPNTPLLFVAENGLATVNSLTGAGTAGTARGTTRIFARLLTNQQDDAVLTIVAPPSSIASVSGGGQTANVNAQLTNPVVVQVNATDGQPAPGVTVTFAAQNGGTVGSASVVTGANGQASTTWRLGPAAGTQTLTASGTGLTGSPVTFSATARAIDPVRLVFVQQPPATATAGATLAPAITVQAVDATNALTPAFTGPVTLALGAGAPAGGTLAGTTTVNAVAGVATFSTLALNVPGTYTLVASNASLTAATSTSITLTAGAANRLVFQNYPTAGVGAGTTLDPITVAVRDALNNTVTTFTGPVTLSPVGPGAIVDGSNAVAASVAAGDSLANVLFSGPVTVNAAAGIATFSNLQLTKAGTYTLAASGTGLTGTSGPSFPVIAGAASSVSLVSGGGQSAPGAAALAAPIVVKVSDNFGNGIAGVTVSFTPASNNGTANPTSAVTAAGGTAQTTWTLGNPGGSQTLNVSSAGLVPNPLAVTATATTTAGPGPAALLSISQGPPASTTAGVAFSPALSVTAKDALNQTATSFTGNVTLAITANPGGGTLGGTFTVAAVAGVATFPGLSIDKAGAGYSLTASSGTLTTATTSLFNITPAAASQIVIASGDGQGGTVNTALAAPFVARVKDAFGNSVAGVSVSWAVASGGGSLSSTTNTSDANGLVQTLLTMGPTAGTNTVTVTSTGLAGSPLTFTANSAPGVATKLAFTTQPANVVAGVNFASAPVVQAQDAFNNPVASHATNILIAISTNPGGATLSGGTTVTPAGGASSFTGLSLNKSGVGYVLTATSGGLTAAVSATFDVAPAAPVAIAADSGDAQSGSAGGALASQIVGRVVDTFGNPVPGVSVTWGTPTAGGSLSGTITTTDANGRVRATWTLGSAGPQSVTLTSAGLSGSPVTFTATGTAANASAVWTGAQDGVWTNPNNWSPPSVPVTGDSLLIQAGGANPTLAANTTVKAIYIADGATLNTGGFTLTVTGNMSAGNTIVGHVTLTGTGTMQGHVTGNVNVMGAYTVVGPDSVGGSLTVGGSGSLTIGAHAVGVGGHFSTATSGVLVMTSAGSVLRVAGDVGFGGGNSTLTDGLIYLKGNFLGASGFAPSGNHLTMFDGATYDVTLSGTPGTNKFNKVLFNQGTATAQTDLWANDIELGLAITNLNGVNGSITARVANSIIDPNARWNIPTVVFTGPMVKIGNHLGGAVVRFAGGGTTSLESSATVSGNVIVESNTTLAIGDKTFSVNGNFGTVTGAKLSMNNGAGALNVDGSVNFGGGATTGLLTGGALTLKGNFSQTNASGGAEFNVAPSFNVILGGSAAQVIAFATPDTVSGACTKSCFPDLIVNKSGGTVALASGARVLGNLVINAGVTNVDAVGTAPSPKPFLVAGNATTDAAVTVHISRFGIGGVLAAGAATTLDTLIFGGTGQTIPAGSYAQVHVKGTATAGGTVTANNLTVGGTLTLGGKRINVGGDFVTTGTGTLVMNNANDSLIVGGSAVFNGGVSTPTAGKLIIGAAFVQGGSTTNAFAASGSHLTKFNGVGNQGINFLNPDLVQVPPNASSCALSCFANVEIDKSAGKVLFNTGAKLLGNLTITNAPDSVAAYGKRVIVGGNFSPTLLAVGSHLGLLSVGGTAANSSKLKVDTLIHWGAADVEIEPTMQLQIWGTNDIKGSSRSFGGNVALFGSGTLRFLAASTAINGSFSTNGGTNTFDMVHDSVNVIVSGAINLAGGAASTPAAGHLHVSGNFATTGAAFQATGTHVTHFAASEITQTIAGSAPVTGQGLRHVMFEGGGSKVISGSLNITGNVTIDETSASVTGEGATVFIGGDFSDATQQELPNLRAGPAQLRATDPHAARANAIATYARRRAAMRATEASAPRVMAPRSPAPRARTKTPAVRTVGPSVAMLAAAAAVPPVSLVDPLGGWQVENTTFAGSSLVAQVMTTNLTITGQASLNDWMEINGDVVVEKVSGSAGQLVLNGHELVISGNFTTAASGTVKLTDESDGLFVGGNATFGGGSTAGLLTSGYLEVVGSFAQSGSSEAFKPDALFPTYLGYIEYGCGECEFKANARGPRPALRAGMMASEVMPSSISFANPGEGAGKSHFGRLYLQGLEIDLQSDVYALSTLETGIVSTIHVSTATPTRKIVSHGADVRNLSFDNVRWELLDGAGIGSMDDVTFNVMDPAVDQFTMTRNGALPPLCDCSVIELWYWTFNTVPTSGTYIKATDTDGATNGALKIRMQYPNPTVHGGKISLNGGAEMHNWLSAWVWLGTFSTGWNHVNNWGTSNALPDYLDDVTIPAGTTYSPRLNFDASVRSLTIESGASLDLNGKSLAVHGNLSGPTATTAIVCGGCEASQPVKLVGSGAVFTVAGRFLDLQVGDAESSTLVDYRIPGGGSLIVNEISIGSGDFALNGGNLFVNVKFEAVQSGRLIMNGAGDQLTVTGGQAEFNGLSTAGLLSNGTITLNDAHLFAGESESMFAPSGAHKVVVLGTSQVTFDDPGSSHFHDLTVEAGSNTTLNTDIQVKGTFKRNTGAAAVTLAGNGGNTRYLTVNGIDVGTNPTTLNSVAVKMENAGTFTAFSNITFGGFNAYTGAVVNIARAGTIGLDALNFSAVTALGSGGIFLENSGPGTINVTNPNPLGGCANAQYKVTGTGSVNWGSGCP
jgi:hypothetical protein